MFDKLSVDDVIGFLNTSYDEGVRMKKSSLKNYEDSMHGTYSPKMILILPDGPKGRPQPPLNTAYKAWRSSVLYYLSLPVIPKIYRGQFADSEGSLNLDIVRSPQSIRAAYDDSLKALLKIIHEINPKNDVLRIISLRKIDNLLYVHVDPDNRDVLIHTFNPESPLLRVFEYIYANEGVSITSTSIPAGSQGSNPSRNISEDLRAMHISITLKRLFFPGCSASRAVFNNRVELSSDELDKLLIGLKTDLVNR